MKKKNKKMWKSFLINVLGVIVGIALTFGGNALWQKREEKKKTKEILILVRNELETNKIWFKSQNKEIKNYIYVYKKLLDANGDWSTFPIDTLNNYRSVIRRILYSRLTTSSWQIFQNSEVIQKMPDKKLIIELSTCYFWIEKIHEIIMNSFWDKKEKIKVVERDPYKFFDAVMLNKETFHFYESLESFEGILFDIDVYIDYLLFVLEKNGYKYDMDEEDSEYELFAKERYDKKNQKNDTIQIKNENQ